ncbi:MAG: uroporphyrinogen-III C-methyltransferase [Pseudomonadota bacterium]
MAKNGKVYLIGAGPGDVELLTLKAVRALRECEVLLLDDLVNRAVLQFAGSAVRVIEMGKRGGCKSTPQPFIERKMIALARQGKVVGRVKGGDPFVFGRGGEEMLALKKAGIAVEVVNGITAGLAAPATLGIPLTQRDCCHGVTLVTGHTRDGGVPNWKALAASGTTLVIYMGMANLRGIGVALLQAGMAGSTPAAAIQHGTLAGQRSVVTDLAHLADAVAAAGLASPAVLVIGEVADMANTQSVALRAVA